MDIYACRDLNKITRAVQTRNVMVVPLCTEEISGEKKKSAGQESSSDLHKAF